MPSKADPPRWTRESGKRPAAAGGGSSAPSIPAWLEPLLQEYDFSELDLEQHAVTIIERTLEHGGRAEVRWMLRTYGVERVRAVVRDRGARRLSPRSFALWRLVLRVESWRPHPWPDAARGLWNPGG